MITLDGIPKPEIEGVSIKEVKGINFKPHAPVIGLKTMRSVGNSGVIGGDALCSLPGCDLKMSEHTHEDALLLEVDRQEENPGDIPGMHDYLLKLKPILESKGLTGVAFIKKRIPKVWRNYHRPPSYHLGDEGCACSLEPPNHPRYFVRSIYNRHGNSPPKPPYYYYRGNGYEQIEDIDSLFEPLPLEHIRVQEWVKAVYRHLHNCYHDESKQDKMIIFPVPHYELKRFTDDLRFSEEWRTKEREAIEQANSEIIAHAAKLATPDNHKATITVRKYYPDFQPTSELIADQPESSGDWWERLEQRPTPETCPGDIGRPHPVNGSWCQFCGWHAKEIQD